MKAKTLDTPTQDINAENVLAAITMAVNAAVTAHRKAGNPVADWRDGKVVLMRPEDFKTAAE